MVVVVSEVWVGVQGGVHLSTLKTSSRFAHLLAPASVVSLSPRLLLQLLGGGVVCDALLQSYQTLVV